MGIHGLTGFIDNNQHVLHEHQLHDCSVVLDGNNFYHFLYYACHVRCGFGGDYDIFRKKIISTFESFKMCGITPYVVMDGAYTVDGRKLRTSLARALARIKLVDVMVNHQRGQALPVLAYETFMQTLNELGICNITCQFEADNEAAVLANKLQCPVISNDSDFYIFDLSNGFLPMDYLDFRPLEKQTPDGSTLFRYLHCQKYHVNDFINSFDGLNRSVLPVFASLLGNDFINPSAFSTFYSRVKVPKIISKKFSLPPRLSKVISVLHWLHSKNGGTEFVDIKREILEFIKPRRKEIVERLFVSSVNGYIDVENFQGFDLFHYITDGPGQCQLTALEDFRSYGGKVFPDWFLKAVCCGEITPSILNCAILHRVILLAQVEDLNQASSFVCSLGLRRIIYGILFKDDCSHTVNNQDKEDAETDKISSEYQNNDSDLKNEKFAAEKTDFETNLRSDVKMPEDNTVKADDDESGGVKEDDLIDDSDVMVCENDASGVKTGGEQKKVKDSCVEEYTRINKNLLKSFVQPLLTIGNVPVPSLTSLGTMTLDGRRHVLAESLGVSDAFMGKFCEDLQLFAACIVMWSRNVSPKITLGHLDSVITGVIVVTALASLAGRKGELKEKGEGGKSGRKGEIKERGDGDKSLRKDEIKEKGEGGKSGRKGELKERGDGDKSGGKGEIKERGDGDKSGRKDEIREKGDRSGRKGEIKEKGNDRVVKKDMSELGDSRKEVVNEVDDDDIFERNAESKKDSNGKLDKSSDELEKTDISEVGKPSSLVEGDNSTDVLETPTHDGDVKDPEESIKYSFMPINIGMICSQAAVNDLEDARENLSKYHAKSPSFNHKNHFNPRICHAFAQLQACILDAINLNKLLRFPFPNICPADLINGTFLYNFYGDISTRSNCDLFLATMLGRNSNLFSTFELFRNTIVDFVGVGTFVSANSLSKKSRKRKSRVKGKEVGSGEVDMENNSEDKELSTRTISGFNVDNMFSVLSLEENL